MEMKNLLIFIITLIVSTSAFAGSGKSIISHWASWGANSVSNLSYVYISNITSHTINVKVKFYDKNGAVLAPSNYSNFVNGNTQLAGNSSGFLTILVSPYEYGYATIEWWNQENEDDTVALVANSHIVMDVNSNLRSDLVIQVNNGQPF